MLKDTLAADKHANHGPVSPGFYCYVLLKQLVQTRSALFVISTRGRTTAAASSKICQSACLTTVLLRLLASLVSSLFAPASDWRWQKQVSDAVDYAALHSPHSTPGGSSPLCQRAFSPHQVHAACHALPPAIGHPSAQWSASVFAISCLL